MRAILVGIGSLGTIVGGLISKNGGDITLVDVNQANVDALNANGASVTGKMIENNIPVKAITPDKLDGIYDVAILLTKQTYNEVSLKQLLPHLGPDSVVCTLQNGVPEESVAEYVGAHRTIGGTVGWGATWIKPGLSELTSDQARMRIEIGELDGTITDRLKSVAAILSKAGMCDCITNLVGVRWSKLLMNSTMSGMSAALGCRYCDVLDDDKAVACAAHLTNELIQVADARKIELQVLVPGYNFYDLRFADKAGRDKAVVWLRDFYIPDRPLKASMLQDMEKGIKSEIMQINGVVSAWGKKLGVPTPMNDAIVKIVTEFEAGKRPFPTMACLDDFAVPALT